MVCGRARAGSQQGRLILPGLPVPVLLASVLMLLVHTIVRPLVAMLLTSSQAAHAQMGSHLHIESVTGLLLSGLAVIGGSAAWRELRKRGDMDLF